MPIPYNISQSPVPVGISGTPTGATQRQAYSWSPTITGGFGVRTFTMTGNLPERMTFNPFTGTIAGIPRHVISVSGLSITVTDASGSATLSNLTIPVASAISNLMITGTPAAATVGTAFTFTPTVTGGSGPRTFSFSGRLEDGLRFNPVDGSISGTPAEDGGSFFIITVQDSVDTATLSGTVVASYPGAVAGLTLSPSSASIASNTVSGTQVFSIGNVPVGSTPTLTPNDGRFVIAGSAGAWTVVVGLSALSAGFVSLTVSATGAQGVSGNVTINAAGSGNVLPTAALSDVALEPTANNPGANQYMSLGALTIPSGDWVVHLTCQMMRGDNAYDQPLLYIAPSGGTNAGTLNGPGQLVLAFMVATSSNSIDPARGSLILSGKDDAGNWLTPQSNRSISSYWGTLGSNVQYISGPAQNPPTTDKQSIFIQKSGGRVQLWIVQDGATALIHDFAASSFGVLTGANAFIGYMPNNGQRAAGVAFQRFFVAAGSLTPAQMEGVAQGVDPRQYLAFDQPTDRLTNWQNAGTTAQPDLVGSGSTTLASSGAINYRVKTTPLIPNTVLAEQPRVSIENNQVFQRTAVSSDLTLSGRVTGLDDDIYVQIVDSTTTSTVVKAWTKIATSVNGAWSGTISAVPSALQWYSAQIRKGTGGTPYLLKRKFGVGIVIDAAGQSIMEKLLSTTGTTMTGGSANFLSIFSRAKSDSGSTQGTQRRGWYQTNFGGYGWMHTMRLISEGAQCPVGGAMSAMEGSGIDAWVPGATSAYVPATDTWARIKPGYLFFGQGQGSTGVSPADYTTFLTGFRTNTKTDKGWSKKLIIQPLIDNGALASSGGVFTGLRLAQAAFADNNVANDVSNSGNHNDLALVDTVHPTSNIKGQGRIAERFAWQVLFHEGVLTSSAKGAVLGTPVRTGAQIDIPVIHNGGTALQTPNVADITGFIAKKASDSSALTISSAAILDGSTIRLTLSADPGAAVAISYQNGNPGPATTPLDANGFIPGVSNPVYDNRAPGMNPALGIPVMFTPAADLVTPA